MGAIDKMILWCIRNRELEKQRRIVVRIPFSFPMLHAVSRKKTTPSRLDSNSNLKLKTI